MKKDTDIDAVVSEFLGLKERLMASLTALLACIRGPARRAASKAAKALQTIAGELPPSQCTEVIESLRQMPETGSGGAMRDVISVFGALPRDIPEDSREHYFGALLICIEHGSVRNFRLASRLFLERVAEAPSEALCRLMKIAHAVYRSRTRKTGDKILALRLLFFAQYYHAEAAKGASENIGIRTILQATRHPNDDIRAMANSTLKGLSPVLPVLMTDDIASLFGAIIRCDTSHLGPKKKERAEMRTAIACRTIGEAPGTFPALAKDLLAAMTADLVSLSVAPKMIEREFRPPWAQMGFRLSSYLPFEEVWPLLRSGLLVGGDITPMNTARIIASYGPEARGALREMVQLFKQHHGDCSMSAPLLWAILNVGIGTETPKRILAWLRKQKRTCPHAAELEYLVRNGRPKPEPAYLRRLFGRRCARR